MGVGGDRHCRDQVKHRINSYFDKLFVMPKSPQALLMMPPAAAQALKTLGENLANVLERDVRAAVTRRAVQSAASARARLAHKPLKAG